MRCTVLECRYCVVLVVSLEFDLRHERSTAVSDLFSTVRHACRRYSPLLCGGWRASCRLLLFICSVLLLNTTHFSSSSYHSRHLQCTVSLHSPLCLSLSHPLFTAAAGGFGPPGGDTGATTRCDALDTILHGTVGLRSTGTDTGARRSFSCVSGAVGGYVSGYE